MQREENKKRTLVRFPQGHRMMKKYMSNLPRFILEVEIVLSEYPTYEFTNEIMLDLYMFVQEHVLEFNFDPLLHWKSPWFEEHSGLFFYGMEAKESECFFPKNYSSKDMETMRSNTKTTITNIYQAMIERYPFAKNNCQLCFSVREIDFHFPFSFANETVGELNENITKDDDDEQEEEEAEEEEDDNDEQEEEDQPPHKREKK